ncbi:hypothetical protein C0995_003855, partial [Termitomyces sp. Mi166
MVTSCYKIINACAGKFTDQCIQELQANPDVEGIYEDGLGGLPRGKNLDFAHMDQENSLTRLQANPDVEGIYKDGLRSIDTASEGPSAIHKYLNVRTNATWALARLSSKAKLNYTSPTACNFKFYYDPRAGQGSDIYVLGVYRLTLVDVQGGEPHLLESSIKIGMVMELTAPGTTWGVAKKANIISVKILNWLGIAGLDYVYQKALASSHPAVVSISAQWEETQPLDDAVEKAGAGNDRKDASAYSPARAPSAITIAASNILDKQTEISNYGKSVFMFAPGEAIYSTDIGHRFAIMIRSGTSASAALVAGIVASLLKDEKLSINRIKDELHKMCLQNVVKDI